MRLLPEGPSQPDDGLVQPALPGLPLPADRVDQAERRAARTRLRGDREAARRAESSRNRCTPSGTTNERPHGGDPVTTGEPRVLVRFSVPGEPVAKARARSMPVMRGGRPVLGAGGRPIVAHHTPEKTQRYENLVSLAAEQAMDGHGPSLSALRISVLAVFAIPGSWSGRKQRAAVGAPVLKRPDLDNVVKALKDGMNGVVWKDDSQVAEIIASKVYGERPRVDICVEALA